MIYLDFWIIGLLLRLNPHDRTILINPRAQRIDEISDYLTDRHCPENTVFVSIFTGGTWWEPKLPHSK